MEPKPGTKWVGKGEGATVKNIDRRLPGDSDLENHAIGRCFDLYLAYGVEHRTNLALTGEPLNDEDLKRISECE